MKGLQIIGDKGSGKSTLILKIGEILNNDGIKPIYIKHCHHRIKLKEKDERFLKNFSAFFLIDDKGVFSFKEKFSFEEILLQDGFFLIEGFKNEDIFPKILCLRGKNKGNFNANYFINMEENWEDEIKKILKKIMEEKKIDIEVLQGNELLAMKPFLKEMLKSILISFFKNLKLKEEKWIKIYLKVK